MFKYLTDLISLAQALGIDLAPLVVFAKNPVVQALFVLCVIAIPLFQYLRISITEVLAYLWRSVFFIFRRALGGTSVLLLTDADETGAISVTLSHQLQRYLREHRVRRVRVRALEYGDQLLYLPMFPTLVRAVVIITTDVTPLSTDIKKRNLIQAKLRNYCRGGGTLILTHDTLYRRAKNEMLQQLAGCAINEFEQIKGPIEYVKVVEGPRATTDAQLVAQLPQTLYLEDNEIVSGQWVPGVEYLYVASQNPHVPLVTRKAAGRGSVYWCNTGDRDASGPPPALVRGDSQFTSLIGALITFGSIAHYKS